jgi:phosphonate transport system substrate-binding protein
MKAPLAAAAILALATTMLVQAEAASAAATIHFVDTGMEGLEQLQVEFGPFRDALAEITGLKVEFYPLNNGAAAAEAMRDKDIDFALAGPSEYVILRSKTKAVPVAAFSRVDYYSEIVVRADSGISTIGQLKGKRIAFDEIGSTSGHLAPAVLLADAGLDPVSGIEPVHTSHQIAFEALKGGDVAAWATRWVNFNTARDADAGKGSQPGDFRVIARGPDLPDDVLVAGSHVDPAIVAKVKEAFEKPESAARLKAALRASPNGETKYALTVFLTGVAESDYDYIRHAYQLIGEPQFSDLAN